MAFNANTRLRVRTHNSARSSSDTRRPTSRQRYNLPGLLTQLNEPLLPLEIPDPVTPDISIVARVTMEPERSAHSPGPVQQPLESEHNRLHPMGSRDCPDPDITLTSHCIAQPVVGIEKPPLEGLAPPLIAALAQGQSHDPPGPARAENCTASRLGTRTAVGLSRARPAHLRQDILGCPILPESMEGWRSPPLPAPAGSA